MKSNFYHDQPRLVICGSMAFYSDMLEVRAVLQNSGIPCIIPKAEDKIKAELSTEQFEDFKQKVSSEYLKEVRDKRTFAILAVNKDKRGIASYIGPNTFGEIAVAFAHKKDIYLFYGIPEMYEDELVAWKAKILRGSLTSLIQDYKRKGYLIPQPPLFPNL